MTRKYSRRLDCPLDTYFYHPLAQVVVRVLGCLARPNYDTTASLAFYVAGLFYLPSSSLAFVLLFIAGYVCDAADGRIARNCQMYSKAGEIYDLLKDVGIFTATYIVVYILYQPPVFVYVPFLLVFSLVSGYSFGLLEIYNYYEKIGKTDIFREKENKFAGTLFGDIYLNVYEWPYRMASAAKDSEKSLRLFRWFGPGTGTTVVILGTLLVKGLCGS